MRVSQPGAGVDRAGGLEPAAPPPPTPTAEPPAGTPAAPAASEQRAGSAWAEHHGAPSAQVLQQRLGQASGGAGTLPPPPSADQARASWRPGHYPPGASLEDVASGAAYIGINQGGPHVSSLQQKLNQLGIRPPLAVDGKFGPMTLAALQKIQGELGLQPTGTLDAASLAEITSAVRDASQPDPWATGTDDAPGGSGATGATGTAGATGGAGFPFTPNPAALAEARSSPLGDMIAKRTPRFADTYKQAAAATGVPATMIAAIHFNESHQGSRSGPESGFGLDPRHISTAYGNTLLRRAGQPTPWQRGGSSDAARLQSAVIAAGVLKTNADYLGVTIGPNMSANEVGAVITAYGAGAGVGKKVLESGRSFVFDPADPQPYVRHPGGSSIDESGSTVRVAPGIKKGLLRWDVLLPLMGEQLGETGFAGGAAPTGPDGTTATERAPARPTASGALGLPPRPAGAPTGSQFLESTRGVDRTRREQMILEQIESGNVPDFARQLKPVTTTIQGADGRQHTATFFTMPDYLSIGSDADFVRIPMSPLTAQKIADRLGMSLPTRTMVDAIYDQAEVKLTPSPMQPGPQMMSSDYYLRHQQTIERQRSGQPLGALTAGHKKDLILTNRLLQKPGSVAIYGWHQRNGKPIQPRSTVHENTYADYSHGARLVSGTVRIDGVDRPLAEVLQDPTLAPLFSDEGVLRVTRQPRVPR